MNASPQLLAYNVLAICFLTFPQAIMTITCDIQPTGAVTMAMEVLHNSCSMCIHDLPGMYALNPQVSDIGHIYQPNHPFPCYNN